MLSSERSRKQMLTQQQRNNRRRRANPRQLAFLRKKFIEDPKPDQTAREKIGQAIDMTPRSVQIWFQNNRAKTKDQERKFSMHGKLFAMTTKACSENVSCVQAGGGDQACATYDPHGYIESPLGPYRIFTPPPGRSRFSDGCTSEWWENNFSHPSLHFELTESQRDRRFVKDPPRRFTRPRAQSALDVGYSRATDPVPQQGMFSFLPNYQASNGQTSFTDDFDTSFETDSPISAVVSSTSESCDLPNTFTLSLPDLNNDIAGLNYSIDCDASNSPDSFGPDLSSTSPKNGLTGTPSRGHTILPEHDNSTRNENENENENENQLDTLVNALDLRKAGDSLNSVADFIKVPCSLARIGQYLTDETDHEFIALYSPSQQILQMVISDIRNREVTIMEKDVLHFPSSPALQFSSFGYSQIDVEVFGTPRIRTEDFNGQQQKARDPTDGEIFSVQQCRFFGDFSDQLEMMRALETPDLELSSNWLTDSADLIESSDVSRTLSADCNLLFNDKPSHTSKARNPFTANHAIQASYYYI